LGQNTIQTDEIEVTVLLPCYNAMPFLEEALSSIRQQTYSNLEIMCIDDGSSDNTYQYLLDQAQIDPRIILIKNEQNLGLIKTLNKGVQLANGKYIARMDADDIAFPERIKICLDYLESHPEVDLVCPMSKVINENGNITGKFVLRNQSKEGNYFASFLYTPVGHPEIMCKKDLLMDNPYSLEPKALHTEDYELWTRLLSKGYHFVNIPQYLQYFRVNSNSVSNKYTDIQDENFLECASDHYFHFTGHRLELTTRKIFRNRITGSYSTLEIRNAVKELKSFTQFFIQKEKIENSKLIQEITGIYRTHKMDILIQAFKRGAFSEKSRLFFPLFGVLFSSLFHKLSRTYLFSKFGL